MSRMLLAALLALAAVLIAVDELHAATLQGDKADTTLAARQWLSILGLGCSVGTPPGGITAARPTFSLDAISGPFSDVPAMSSENPR